jgi:hypothetical protein
MVHLLICDKEAPTKTAKHNATQQARLDSLKQ